MFTTFRNIQKPIVDDQSIDRRKVMFSAVISAFFVFMLWMVHTVSFINQSYWHDWGIFPRQMFGLKGIIFSPLIHLDYNHLISNSIPMFVLFASAIYFFRIHAFKALLFIWIFTGLGVWLFARESYHIGASGLVYGLAAFLGLSGIIKNDIRLISLTFLIVFLYGGMVWGALPIEPAISWESHLFGGTSGILVAILYRNTGPKSVPYFIDEPLDEKPSGIYLNNDPLNGKLVRYRKQLE